MTKEEKNLQNAMTEGVIWKQLLLFFFPIVLGTFFQQLYNTADAIIVGKFVGKEALAAVGGTTGTLINLLVGFFVGLSSGASVIISQFFGARRPDDVSRAVHTTMALALASGAALTVLGIWSSRAVLVMMGTPEDVLGHAVTYINIYFLGMIPSLIYNIGSGILRAVVPGQAFALQVRAAAGRALHVGAVAREENAHVHLVGLRFEPLEKALHAVPFALPVAGPLRVALDHVAARLFG